LKYSRGYWQARRRIGNNGDVWFSSDGIRRKSI
jgi:hypothetical protein